MSNKKRNDVVSSTERITYVVEPILIAKLYEIFQDPSKALFTNPNFILFTYDEKMNMASYIWNLTCETFPNLRENSLNLSNWFY